MCFECLGICIYVFVNVFFCVCNFIIILKLYINYFFFRWFDGYVFNFWIFGVKVFNLGVVMVFSFLLFYDVEYEYIIFRDERLGYLDIVIGVLGMMISEEVEGGLNFRVL